LNGEFIFAHENAVLLEKCPERLFLWLQLINLHICLTVYQTVFLTI